MSNETKKKLLVALILLANFVCVCVCVSTYHSTSWILPRKRRDDFVVYFLFACWLVHFILTFIRFSSIGAGDGNAFLKAV